MPKRHRYLPAIAAFLAAGYLPLQAQSTFIASGADWRFLDTGVALPSEWRTLGFDDSLWPSGPAQLGYGDGDEATLVGYGPNASAKYITTYFRRVFNVPDPNAVTGLKLELLRDDGAVVYLNGTEVARSNLPTGTINASTLAPVAITGADETTTFYPFTLSPSQLVAGPNIVAVEIHQQSGTSSDISFDLRLTDGGAGAVLTRGPYLQLGTPTGVTVRWRTDVASSSRVRVGTTADSLSLTFDDATVTTEHAVVVQGLLPDTQYFYGVGSTSSSLASGPEYTFYTPPTTGTAQATRIWVLGDSGTANATASAVRNGYSSYAAGRYTDVWLMLGDDAYNTGTDAEFQAAVFNMYPSFLRQTVLWSAIGNHETAGASNPSLSIPYFQIFNLPTAGEAGGVASGTEKYYSFDHGRIHFIALDSMTSSRLPGSTMLTWLQADLAATTQDWIIAFWHHPPYTKGSHNSDTETELIQMRENVLPILEAGGVDLVLAGHSHSYERSYLINGHYGLSSTFTDAMKLDAGNGREAGNGAYTKPEGLTANQGVVYIVAGNGGKVTSWTGGSTAEYNPTPHPAMFYSALHVGSLAIDVVDNRLEAKMIRETGAVDDYFTIVKTLANTAPTISLSSPAEGTSYTAPATVTMIASAADSDGTVQQVDFYANGTPLTSVTAAPYSFTWNGVAAGTYALTAIATDNLGASAVSAPVTITVTGAVPAVPTGLAATPGNAQVVLTWNVSSGASNYRVKRAPVSTGPFAEVGSNTTTTYTDTGLVNGSTYYYVVSAVNAAGESANSAFASATLLSPPAAPSGLLATAVSKTQINLNWTDNASNESGYLIERSLNGTSFTQIALTAANVRTYSNTGLAGNKTYYYRVRATNAVGSSAYSNTSSAKTPKK